MKESLGTTVHRNPAPLPENRSHAVTEKGRLAQREDPRPSAGETEHKLEGAQIQRASTITAQDTLHSPVDAQDEVVEEERECGGVC